MFNSHGMRLAAAVLTLGIMGCFTQETDRTAGVDDFPNSVYARVDGFLGQPAVTGAVPALPSGAQTLFQGGALPPAPKMSAGRNLGKLAMGSSGLWTWDTSKVLRDTLSGDIIAFQIDTIQGTGTPGQEPIFRIKTQLVYTTGKVVTLDRFDADGDSSVTVVAGRASKVRIILIESDSGIQRRANMVLGPGPDNNLDSGYEADNLTYEASWVLTRGPDTLSTAVYEDPDGGILVDNAAASVVIINYRENNPVNKPETAESRIRLRMRTHYKAQGDLLGISGEERLKNGRINTFALSNPSGAGDLDFGNMVRASLVSHGAPGEILDSSSLELLTYLGGSMDDKSDDRIQEISITFANRQGEERRGVFHFASLQPMAQGEAPRNGSLSMSLEYQDGTTLVLNGNLLNGALSAELTDRGSRKYRAYWDPAGRLLSVKLIP